jgi:hypothetical protein
VVAIVGSLGLIAQAIDLLVITAAQIQQSNYVSLSILIVVEIIPALVFLFMIEVKSTAAMKSKMSTTKGTSTQTRTEGDDSDDGVIKIPYSE